MGLNAVSAPPAVSSLLWIPSHRLSKLQGQTLTWTRCCRSEGQRSHWGC